MLPYHEGDWFSIPLGSGGFVLGLIARSNGKGQLFCYFFGPRRPTTPKLEETLALKPGDALLHTLCNDAGLIRKNWRCVGRPMVWDRFDWPIPLLSERDASGSVQAVQYDDSLSSLKKTAVKLSKGEVERLQGAGMAHPSDIEGYLEKAVEKLKAQKLQGRLR